MEKYLKSNTKLRKDGIWSFGLPPLKTCPMAGNCKKYCYAQKGMYRVFSKKVKEGWKRSLDISMSPKFVDVIIAEIRSKRKKPTAIRIHSEGDFYSQVYLNKWTSIARQLPDIVFYAYSKSLHLDFSDFLNLPNTKVIQSVGGKLDHQMDMTLPHAVIFDDLESLLAAGYVDCSKSDLIAIRPDVIKIGLVKH